MCLYPKLIKNPKYRPNKKNNWQPDVAQDRRVEMVPIGCGMCMECARQRANQWKTRLMQDIEQNTNGKFVTLTLSNESYAELAEEVNAEEGYPRDNAIITLGVRKFLERYRKQHKRSLRHWLITELGGNGTENIHAHGIVWSDDLNNVEKHWKYGFMWKGKRKNGRMVNYVSSATVNYMMKYVTKVDAKHKYYKPIILCSPGIGSTYTKTYNASKNKFAWENTKETYTTRQGREIQLPIYWRNSLWNEDQREQLWLQKLDKQIRWVNGEKIDISKGEENYNKVLKWHQERNRELGYGDPENWEAAEYERQRRVLKQQERIKNTRNRVRDKSK